MARIELAAGIGDDFERILDHWRRYEVADPEGRLEEILQSIDVLKQSPLIGRPLAGGLRELIIGRRSRGYIALYRYVVEADIVFVLAIRSQREAGYAPR